MTDLHEFDLISGTLESADNPVNAVAGVAVDSPHPPRRQSFQKKIADLLRHGRHPIVVSGLARRGISDPFHPRLGILRSTFSCIFSMRPNGAVGIGKRAEIRSKQLRSCLAPYLPTGQTLSSAEHGEMGRTFTAGQAWPF